MLYIGENDPCLIQGEASLPVYREKQAHPYTGGSEMLCIQEEVSKSCSIQG